MFALNVATLEMRHAQKVTNKMSTTLYITISILTIGIFDTRKKINKTIEEDSEIEQFIKNIYELYNKINNNKNANREVEYIIAKSKYIDYLLGINSCYSIISKFTNNISQGIYNYQEGLINSIRKYSIQHKEFNTRKRKELRQSAYSPLILFYRGIERILKFIIPNHLSLFKIRFNYNSRAWNLTVKTVTFISVIMTILSFFGITFETVISQLKSTLVR